MCRYIAGGWQFGIRRINIWMMKKEVIECISFIFGIIKHISTSWYWGIDTVWLHSKKLFCQFPPLFYWCWLILQWWGQFVIILFLGLSSFSTIFIMSCPVVRPICWVISGLGFTVQLVQFTFQVPQPWVIPWFVFRSYCNKSMRHIFFRYSYEYFIPRWCCCIYIFV